MPMIFVRYGLLLTWCAGCALNVALWPRNRFEWMLDEPGAARDGLTFCGLPLDQDASFGEFFAIAPVLATLAVGLFFTVRKRIITPSLVVALSLLVLWITRFHVMINTC